MSSITEPAPNAWPEARSQTPSWSFKDLRTLGASEWSLSERAVVAFSIVIPLAVLSTGLATILMGPAAFKWFTREDGFAEGVQVVLWGIALALGAKVMNGLWQAGSHGLALIYLGLNFAMIFIIGEELSWGQRIMGWQTPEALSALNRQGETNVHNIRGIEITLRWIHIAIGAYGTFVPLLLMRSSLRFGRLGPAISRLVPHYTLVPYFFIVLVWRLQATLWNPPRRLYFVVSEFSEVVELILATAALLFMLYQIRRAHPFADAPARPRVM